MAFTLQTQQLFEPEELSSAPPPIDPLTHETGWSDVGAGLSRVLLGYLLSFLCLCLGIGLLLWLGLQAASGDLADPDGAVNASIGLLVGGCIIGLLSLVSFGLTLAGKWACAMHAPERCGARWFIFATITCMVIGPVVNVIAGFAGADDLPAAELAEEHPASAVPDALTQPPTPIQLAGSAVSLATTLFFVLFLRSIGLCFEAVNYVRMAELFLLFTGTLLGFTFFLLYGVPLDEIPPLIFLAVGAAWLASLLGYVALVFGARLVIAAGLERVQASKLT